MLPSLDALPFQRRAPGCNVVERLTGPDRLVDVVRALPFTHWSVSAGGLVKASRNASATS
jgi:hypothetical protein